MRKLEIEMAHPRRCAGAYRIVSEKGAGREPKPQIIHLSYCAAVFGWTHARHIVWRSSWRTSTYSEKRSTCQYELPRHLAGSAALNRYGEHLRYAPSDHHRRRAIDDYVLLDCYCSATVIVYWCAESVLRSAGFPQLEL
jgi:hypothetical protein